MIAELSRPDAPARHARMADALRMLAIDAIERAGSGHPGMPLGMADVTAVLFDRFLRIDPAAPNWPDRDRFVLSAGHGSMLQYAVHHLLGYADMGDSALRAFRQLGSTTPGHPEYGHSLGIETTTGPLGQGIATAVGMAIAQQMEQARFGCELSDHAVWVIAGDGCLQEGICQEAIDVAGHLQLPNLVVLWDDNRISIDGATSVSTSTDQCARFRASGWAVMMVDGHDHQAVAAVLAQARDADRPVMVACRTEIGRGAPTVCGTEKAHGAPLGADGCAAARAALGWVHEPFAIPDEVVADWRGIAERSRKVRTAWQARLDASSQREAFEAFHSRFDTSAITNTLAEFRTRHREAGTRIATRQASQLALAAINQATDRTIGGSADLTHSNLTLTQGMDPVRAGHFGGRYIHYGIREHAMAAVMNGIALHGGYVPYGGTFLSFADYARGAIRLSALMGVRVVYVMTHDSIGLGEDGPTHQPVEHLAMLRATPNLAVYRPADVIETAEAWELALADVRRPSVLVLSRQALPMLRAGDTDPAEATGRGGYVLRQPDGPRDVTLLATGSEVEIAVAAALILGAQGIAAAVVSLPCWERFEAQEQCYRDGVLGSAPRVGVEAAARLGWDRWIGDDGAFVGMSGFGASAPAAELYQHFGITAEAVAAAARTVIDGRKSA